MKEMRIELKICYVLWAIAHVLPSTAGLARPGDDNTPEKIYGDPKRIQIINIRTINQKGVDYAPTVSADGKTLYFVSEREGGTTNGQEDEPSHDFWRVKKLHANDTVFSDPQPLTEINTAQDEGVASISADRQTLYYAVCDRSGGFGSCDIWEAQVVGDRFVRPRMLGQNVNTKYWESQPYIAPDGSRLYFASNRPRNPDAGSNVDDYDIWYCDWDEERRQWLPAKNLGPEVNTEAMEAAPYIAPDGKTLFFSSNGRKPSIGGMDFYYTTRIPDEQSGDVERWTTPELVPQPINSPADDQFLSMPVAGGVLYFASKRKDIPGAKGDFDLYMAQVPKVIGAVNFVVKVSDGCTNNAVPAQVKITNELTKRSVVANVSPTRREANIVLSEKDFTKQGITYDSVTMTIEASSPSIGKQRRQITVPTAALDSTEDIVQDLAINQRKRLNADLQSREGYTNLTFEHNEEQIQQRLLPFVFFDRNSAEIPRRYRRIKPEQISEFREVFPPRSSLTDYYHILNIVGSRLRRLPQLKLVISGHRDELNECDGGLSQLRAQSIQAYLNKTWGIPNERMQLVAGGWPKNRSNPEDSLGAAENRRCELSVIGPENQRVEFDSPLASTYSTTSTLVPTVRFLTGRQDPSDSSERFIELRAGDRVLRRIPVNPDEPFVTWEVEQDAEHIMASSVPSLRASVISVRPDGKQCPCDTTTLPVESTPISTSRQGARPVVYRLHSFDVGTFDLDQVNSRFLDVIVAPGLKKKSVIITGYTDVVGMYDHNQFVSERLAESVAGRVEDAGINVSKDDLRGMGEEQPRYSNRFPEGRFYNRAVELKTK
ncbi:MAG: OmpA family protein [Bacteroidota bacterium]|jgi:outer membrane protein OmpA-like peptidoglycan-associated protein